MSQTSYYSQNAVVGAIQDSIVNKPSGSSVVGITPTIPAAVAETAVNATTPPYWTRSSTTVLVLTMPSAPTWTSSSKMGVFWTGADGTPHFCLDCTCSISGNAVTITAPTLSAQQLADGQTYFNAATTTGASDVSGQYVHAGVTTCTFAVATIATADTPSNPDITSLTLVYTDVLQLLLTATATGGIELIGSGSVRKSWNYSSQGDFYNSIATNGGLAGSVDTCRFYSSALVSQTMKVGALLV